MNELEKLKAKHKKEIATTELKLKVVEALGEELWVPHMYELYGTVGSLSRSTDVYAHKYKNKPHTSIKELGEFLKKFPPIPMYRLRTGGCTTFHALKDQVPRVTEEVELFPPLVLDSDPGNSVTVEWESPLPDFGVFRFEYVFNWDFRRMYSNWKQICLTGTCTQGWEVTSRYGPHSGWCTDKFPIKPRYANFFSSREYRGTTVMYWTPEDNFSISELLLAMEHTEDG